MSEALAAVLSSDDATTELYGPVFYNYSPVSIYIVGTCSKAGTKDAVATLGAYYWGLNSANNLGLRIDGPQTAVRAELTAVLHILSATPLDRPIFLYTSSKFIV